MALPTPNYPSSLWDGNEQSTAADPGAEDPTLAEGRDYTETAAEVVAIADDLINAADGEGQPDMAATIAGLRSAIDGYLTHASQHQHGGSDEVGQSAPGANAIPKATAGGTLSSGWLQPATESARGAAEIATQAETNAGTDDARIVTPLKLSGWHAVTDPFGRDAQTQISRARSTTTATTFQTKTTLTTPALTGTYRVAWMAVVDQSTLTNAVESRCHNVTDVSDVGGASIHEPQDINNRIDVSGFDYVTFTGAAKTFEIQYRSVGGGTSGIAEARIELWRVS